MNDLYAIEERIKVIDINGDILTETAHLFEDQDHKIVVFKSTEDAITFLNKQLASFIDNKLAELNAVLYQIDHPNTNNYVYKLHFSTSNDDGQNESTVYTLSIKAISLTKGDNNAKVNIY